MIVGEGGVGALLFGERREVRELLRLQSDKKGIAEQQEARAEFEERGDHHPVRAAQKPGQVRKQILRQAEPLLNFRVLPQ